MWFCEYHLSEYHASLLYIFITLTDGQVCGLGDSSLKGHVCGAQFYLMNGQLCWSGNHTGRRVERLLHVTERFGF